MAAQTFMDLPLEIFLLIFEYLIADVGIRPAVKSRQTCRTFDRLILDTIYALPTSDQLDCQAPKNLIFDLRMSKSLVVGMISAKLKKKPRERELTREILRTVEVVSGIIPTADREAYTNALVRLAAESLPVHEIVRGLAQVPEALSSRKTLIENASCAAMMLDISEDIQAMYSHGAESRSRTKWFGDALVAASSHASVQTFSQLVEKVTGSNVEDGSLRKKLGVSRMAIALHSAAVHGRTDVYSVPPWIDLLDPAELFEVVHFEWYSPLLEAAAFHGREEAFHAVLRQAKRGPRLYPMECRQNRTDWWEGVLSSAAARGAQRIVRTIIRMFKRSKTTAPLMVGVALEAACREGHVGVVNVLVEAQCSVEAMYWSAAMFWAGWRADQDLLFLLTWHKQSGGLEFWTSALAGASKKDFSALQLVVDILPDWVPAKMVKITDAMNFSQLIDDMYAVWSPGSSHASTGKDSRRWHHFHTGTQNAIIRSAIMNDCFDGVSQLISLKALSNFHDFRHFISGALHGQHHAMMQYIFEKLPHAPKLGADDLEMVDSTAMLQIVRENGGSIQTKLLGIGIHYSRQGNTKSHMQIVEWLCSHGADVNAIRGEEPGRWRRPTETPLGIALQERSYSYISILLDNGADVRQGSPLHYQSRYLKCRLALMDLLIASGACMSTLPAAGEERDTALHRSVELDEIDEVQLLLARGADPDVLDSLGRTPLEVAHEEWPGKQDLLKVLAEHGFGSTDYGI